MQQPSHRLLGIRANPAVRALSWCEANTAGVQRWAASHVGRQLCALLLLTSGDMVRTRCRPINSAWIALESVHKGSSRPFAVAGGVRIVLSGRRQAVKSRATCGKQNGCAQPVVTHWT